jgi:uncharacterized delta-60 repeat protein
MFHRLSRVGLRIPSALLVVTSLLGASAAQARPGAPDARFGRHGIIRAPRGTQFFAVASAPGGSFVVAGSRRGRVFAERISSAGRVLGSYAGPSGLARAVAVAPNRDVILAGSSDGAMLVERLTSRLALERSFGSRGKVSAFGGQLGQANAVTLVPGGSIVAAGESGLAASQAAVIRLTPAGRVLWAKSLDLGPESIVNGLAAERDGSVVLVGQQRPSQITNGVVARLTSRGVLDRTFASGRGAFTYSAPNTGYTSLNAVAVEGDGKIVAAGLSAQGPTMILLRLGSNGSFDHGFGRRGVVTASAGRNVVLQNYPIGAYGLLVTRRGNMVAAGQYENSGVRDDGALWGFSPSGSRVSGFGRGGIERYPSGAAEACAIAVDASGRLIIVGDTIPQMPDAKPCSVRKGSQGFIARYAGLS